MKAKLISLLSILTIVTLISTGCTTPVAIDPQTGQEQLAEYRAGFFYAPLDAPLGQIFKTAIKEMDAMGYYRTGELHKETAITIYARKVGDEKITVLIRNMPLNAGPKMTTSPTQMRIRVGKLGDLAESQAIYARIRNAL